MDRRQKPYLRFFLPTEHPFLSADKVFRFIQALQNIPTTEDVIQFFIWNFYWRLHPFSSIKAWCLEWESSIDQAREVDTIQYRKTDLYKSIKDSPWKLISHYGSRLDNTFLIDAFRKEPGHWSPENFPGSQRADPILVEITTQSWEAEWGHLMHVIERAMREADLQPVFQTWQKNVPDRLGHNGSADRSVVSRGP